MFFELHPRHFRAYSFWYSLENSGDRADNCRAGHPSRQTSCTCGSLRFLLAIEEKIAHRGHAPHRRRLPGPGRREHYVGAAALTRLDPPCFDGGRHSVPPSRSRCRRCTNRLSRIPAAHREGAGELGPAGAGRQHGDRLHREDAYEKLSPRSGEADLIVAKHRNGPTVEITVAFQGHYSRFVDMGKG